MADAETKRRIDTARDILVGKVPDPKSQVEQITIALIYKFMDDMDNEAEEIGGKRSFFSGEFERYGWAKLMDVSLGGHEVLNRYAEALEKMKENQNVPQLFRDIFKNAFLPYRDPETLRSFLKVINQFVYDHSERLGDAFEYLLSIMSSQGDAGQFRTPRHIIDFMVELVDPQKGEKILDPACGTAGFLISSYRHILAANSRDGIPGAAMTPDERTALMESIKGYDISPDMVRLSLVNLYLHGFPTPEIHEYDTLTSEERWNEYADVILANPPFMSPKGGIRPHKRFAVESNRSEVLFVDYIMEHLTANGRAAVIVPEGIIFQSGKAYKELRRRLIENNYLVGVISLPAGIFNPYSGVKTSILWMDRTLARQTDKIVFCKIEHDGFDLGAQRKPNGKNDLPKTIKAFAQYKTCLAEGRVLGVEGFQNINIIEKKSLSEGGGFSLSADRYITMRKKPIKFEMTYLGNQELFDIVSGGTPDTNEPNYWEGDINWISLVDISSTEIITEIVKTERKISTEGLKNSSAKLLPINSVIVSSRATIGRIGINKIALATNQGFKNIIIKDSKCVNYKYVAYVLTNLVSEMERLASGGTFKEISSTNFKTLEIPLPPLDVQEEIVEELEEYKKIINGARMVVENYHPRIEVDPNWPVVKLSDAPIEIVSGATPDSQNKMYWGGEIKWITLADLPQTDFITEIFDSQRRITELGLKNCSAKIIPENSVIISSRATIGRIAINKVKLATNQGFKNIIIKDTSKIDPYFLAVYLTTLVPEMQRLACGGTFKEISMTSFKTLTIALPSIEKQINIVSTMKQENALVSSAKELIAIYEEKIRARVAKVWGSNDERSN